jgi:hypothetical protein
VVELTEATLGSKDTGIEWWDMVARVKVRTKRGRNESRFRHNFRPFLEMPFPRYPDMTLALPYLGPRLRIGNLKIMKYWSSHQGHSNVLFVGLFKRSKLCGHFGSIWASNFFTINPVEK